MAVPLNGESQTDRALRALARQQKEEADGRATAWAVVWTLFGFKMGTVAIIWYAASGSREANEMLLATTWFWLAVPAIALSGAVAYRWRLMRLRRRRHQLRAAEWMTGDPAQPTAVRDDAIRLLMQPEPPQGRSSR